MDVDDYSINFDAAETFMSGDLLWPFWNIFPGLGYFAACVVSLHLQCNSF